jgi:hypothetical protein
MRLFCFAFKTGILIFFLTFLSFNLMAQEDPGRPLPQFLFPGFTKGIVIMKDGARFSFVLNYNMVEERMISEQNGVYRITNNPQDIDTIFLQNRTFVPVEKAFYEVIADGAATFFLQNKSRFTPAGTEVGYGVKSQSVGPTAFRRFEIGSDVVTLDLPQNVTVTPASVNWVRKNNKLEKFTSERQLLKIFPEQETRLKAFIKKEKPDMKVREDVIKLGNNCNELMK